MEEKVRRFVCNAAKGGKNQVRGGLGNDGLLFGRTAETD